jgi:diguanylate cyclase (GGDEF)-like protein
VRNVVVDDQAWTCITIERRGRTMLVLVLAGDWTLSKMLLSEWAARLSSVLQRFTLRISNASTRRLLAAYALPRRLARADDAASMYQSIVETCAKAVDAQKGSIAVFNPEQQSLAITATVGYPSVLVRRLRFRPGAGIIGTVFRTGRAMRIGNSAQLGTLSRPRLRYRTSSFISVPLRGSAGVLGVINVSDRRDGRPFDISDLRTILTLGAVAGLALDRAFAYEEARASARVAAVDGLTGLFNRHHFHTRLEEEVERARRQASPLTLLMLDVDHFKQLNDRLGHLVGDAVLRVVGDVLRRSVRLFDVCARVGGDEFAILMPGSGAESTRHVAERIREGVEDSRPPGGPWADDVRVTASIGIATFAGGTGEELFGRADQAMYAAKRDGRNRIHVTAPPETPDIPIG